MLAVQEAARARQISRLDRANAEREAGSVAESGVETRRLHKNASRLTVGPSTANQLRRASPVGGTHSTVGDRYCSTNDLASTSQGGNVACVV